LTQFAVTLCLSLALPFSPVVEGFGPVSDTHRDDV
jgi:hypothetical protein